MPNMENAMGALVALALLLLARFASSVLVARFQSDGVFRNDSYLRSRDTLAAEPKNFTACAFLTLAHLRGEKSYSVSYADSKSDNAFTIATVRKRNNLWMTACKHKYFTNECVTAIRIAIKEELTFQAWGHFCFLFATVEDDNFVNTTMNTYYGGHLTKKTETVSNPKETYNYLQPGGVLILGQDQDKMGGKFDADQSFSGDISQFAMWDTLLGEDKIVAMAQCKNESEGNLFNWGDLSGWEVSSKVEVVDAPLESLCQEHPFRDNVFMVRKVSHTKFKAFCDKMGGTLPVADGDEQLRIIHDAVFRMFGALGDPAVANCRLEAGQVTFLLGQMYDDKRESWVNPYGNRTNLTMYAEAPIEETEQCAFVRGHTIETTDCDLATTCGVCKLSPYQRLKLKGLCRRDTRDYSSFDIDYYVFGLLNGHLHFKGIMNSHIYFDPEAARWRLQSLRRPERFLLMHDRNEDTLPIGTWEWVLGSDNALCDKSEGKSVILTLTRCYPNKYTCNDGSCIDLFRRCDTEIDCRDKSDEYSCDYLKFGPNYAKELIPRDKEHEGPVPVGVNISILALPHIDTVKLMFTVDFFLRMRWRDSRIIFRDLNNVTSLNSLSAKDRERIWTPRLAFVNALGPYQTKVDDLTSGVLVREDSPLEEDLAQGGQHEAMLFSGSTNSIMLTREYYHDYACDFDLMYYPFDTQMCKMIFEVQEKTDNYVQLVRERKGVEFLDFRDLVEYQIQYQHFEALSRKNISRAQVKIVFRRQLAYHVTNTFLQGLMFILIIIGYMSFYFDVENFTDKIMVTLTTLLVIATIVTALQGSLPKTAYYKAIDWWMLFCIQMLVLTMTVHTYINKLCRDGRKAAEVGAVKNGATVFSRPVSSAGGVKVAPAAAIYQESEDPYARARRMNLYMGKAFFLVVIFLVNVIFWSVVLVEYLRPAELYLTRGEDGDHDKEVH